jgi:cytochrome c oxidase subunit II
MSEPREEPASTDIAALFELRWGLLVAVIIGFLILMIVFTTLHWSSMPPSRVEAVDSTTLHRSGEFIEQNLGTGVDAKGNVVVWMLAQQYAFQPSCIVLPEGVPITFRATSSDAVHGFQIHGTNINSMVVPGYISTFKVTLHGVGERLMPCHEFCGVGHASMWAKARVVPLNEFATLSKKHRRLNCV